MTRVLARRRRATARVTRALLLATVVLAAGCAVRTAPAAALNPIGPVCTAAGWFSGVLGKACNVAQHGGKLLNAGKQLLSGHPGAAAKAILGRATSAPSTGQVIGLAALVAWVNGGAKTALGETATVLDRTTRPQLTTTWFSSTYWRMAGIAALLTLPFLFAAAVQALLHSDLTMLLRAALGYLPLSMLAVAVAAPLTTLLLAASDEMSTIISTAAGQAGAHFLAQLGRYTGVLSVIARSPFLVFLVGLLTAAGAIVLWLELLVRQAAIYIVVLLLPLAFAAFVWPARRTWAIRAVELLVALILSKFVIVAVLSLGGAALGRGGGIGGGMVGGLVLVILGALAPWALVRLLPLTELASSAAGHLRGEVPRAIPVQAALDRHAGGAAEWATTVAADMRRAAAETADDGRPPPPPNPDAVGLPRPVETAGDEAVQDASDADEQDPASPIVFPFQRTGTPLVLGPEAFTPDGRLIDLDPPPDETPGDDRS